ncbi:MAG: hypothetical protein ABI053_02535, partial [Lacisediminihabitans sp.]
MTVLHAKSQKQLSERRTTLPAPKYPRVFGVGRDRVVQYAIFIILAIFVVAPIAPILYQSFRDQPLYAATGLFTIDNYVHLFTDAGFGQVILNTAIFAIGT